MSADGACSARDAELVVKSDITIRVREKGSFGKGVFSEKPIL